ncbi:hypothetical protein Tco_1033876 [Tanacetum coccineum]
MTKRSVLSEAKRNQECLREAKRSKMGDVDINTLTMEQSLTLNQGKQAPGMVKPEIGNNINFEIKSQFMRQLREDTFLGNKNDDANEYVIRALDIIDRIPSGEINTRDLLEKAFIQMHSPPSKITKQLEEIHNFKQEGDKTLYQSWERRTSSGSSDGIAATRSKLDSLGRDMKKLKENVHAIQVGCGLCVGTHLDKECLLNKEVKGVEEVKYGKFGRSFPNNSRTGARYHMGPLRYHMRNDNRPPFRERKPSLEETINKYLEESAKKQDERDD